MRRAEGDGMGNGRARKKARMTESNELELNVLKRRGYFQFEENMNGRCLQ